MNGNSDIFEFITLLTIRPCLLFYCSCSAKIFLKFQIMIWRHRNEIAVMSRDNFELSNLAIDIERLLFRRQFLLGPRSFTPNRHWSCTQLQHGLHLSTHADLPFSSATEQNLSVTLVGRAIDPYRPKAGEQEILHSLIEKTPDLGELIESTIAFIGRWVIIFQDHKDTNIFTDPCGFRQVYYHRDEEEFWCASQPELIKAIRQLQLNTDPLLPPFLTSIGHVQQESPWIGSSTLYENCFHLLPNHYLNVYRTNQVRFYPNGDIGSKTTSEIIQSVSNILHGAMTGLTNRYQISLALTAGVDSRVLLAASRHVSNKIDYFVYRQITYGADHPDIWVPKRIAKELGIKFVVKTPSHHLPGWFVSMLSQNVTCARVLPKTSNIYDKLVSGDNSVNINGNASEICRNFFDKYCRMDIEDVSTIKLAALLFGQEPIPSFATKEIDEWRNKAGSLSSDKGLNILDLLYWEQRLGNWGAQYPAEQDISVEEISPFNCRQLIQTLSAAPRHLRAAPDYPLYRSLIEEMWPEALAFPINPEPKVNAVSAIKNRVRPYIPSAIVRLVKRFLSHRGNIGS